ITIAREGTYYQLTKHNIAYRSCFKPLTTAICLPTLEQSDNSPKVGRHAVKLGEQKIRIDVRSVKGVIDYLGEWAREEVEHIGGSRNPPPLIPDKTGRCGGGKCDILFLVTEQAVQDSSISASYDGNEYYINKDPRGCDRSSQVIELVTEL